VIWAQTPLERVVCRGRSRETAEKGKAYFKGEAFTFDLPEGWNLLLMAEPEELCGLSDVGGAVRELLAHPIGTAPMAEVVAGLPHKETVIISEDQTRPTPVEQIPIPVLNELNRLGISDKEVDVIIEQGTHRVPTKEELRDRVGQEALDRLRVSVHDPDDGEFDHMGTTSRETIKQNHVLIRDPMANTGIMEGNPVPIFRSPGARRASGTFWLTSCDWPAAAEKRRGSLYGSVIVR
jgi:nickel-dependent lactate racemase